MQTTLKLASNFITLTALLMGLALATGCGGGDVVDSACDRLDECNLLNPGVSIEDCTTRISETLDQASSSEDSLWREQMRECLADDTCQEFARCVVNRGL